MEKMLYQTVANEIIHMLSTDTRYCAGTKLPNEQALAEQFQVGRNTIREAVRFLVLHNILEIKRGKGTFVCENTKLEPPKELVQLDFVKIEVKDLFEARLALEPQIAYYAAKRASDKELKKIQSLMEIIENNPTISPEERLSKETDFHNAIIRAAKNDFFLRLIPVIKTSIEKVLFADCSEDILTKSSLEDHRIIMEFLLARDAQSAKYAMRNHIIRCMRYIGIHIE